MEQPSEALQQLLAECGLCRGSELRRCRGRVRRLVRDLPAFDSVWIDALLQARVLTGYQARVLSSNDPGRIRLGRHVLVERLGGGKWSETCLAEVIGQRRERRVLKRLVVPSDILESVTSRMNELVNVAGGVGHPGIVAPRVVRRVGPELVLGSRHVEGPSLRDLLVRRGRFPSDVVEEIGTGLVEALAEFEGAGLVHGDLLASNVRLGADGRAVAVDAGVVVAIEPRLVVDVTRSPGRYDGMSPERVATSGVPTAHSDMYALGCLLFELLAGRPPFPVADAVMKLNAHQRNPVADVRDWAPDVACRLAERVNRLCAHQASDRPGSWRMAREEWRVRRGRSHRQSRSFLRRMRSAAPAVNVAGEAVRGRLGVAIGGTVAAVVVALAAWAGQQWYTSGGSWTQVVSATSQRAVVDPPGQPKAGHLGVAGSVAWPSREDDGTVRLEGSGIRSGTRLEHGVSLLVGGHGAEVESRSEVVIQPGQPLELYSPRVELRGLSFRGPPDEPWVIVHGGVVRVVNCCFLGEDDSKSDLASVAVEVVVPTGEEGVLVEWQGVLVHHVGTGLRIRATKAHVSAVDVVQVGGDSWLDWQGTKIDPGESVQLDLTHCTLRRSRRLMAWSGGDVQIEANDCVLAILTGGVLCESSAAGAGPVRIRGRGTLLTPGTVVMRGRGDVEGLAAAVPTFRGPATNNPQDSALSRVPVGVPGVDGTRPGIRVSIKTRSRQRR